MGVMDYRIRAGAAGVVYDYNVPNSCRFDGTSYLTRTPGSAGNSKTWTVSFWTKLEISAEQKFFDIGTVSSSETSFAWGDGTLYFKVLAAGSENTTTSLYRDPSSWYHVVVAVDTTQATDTNRVKIYVNGEQLTDFSATSYPAQDSDTNMNSTMQCNIGRLERGDQHRLESYLAEFYSIDGTALTPSSFAGANADTGQWEAKSASVTYGTNGFYLNFSNSAALGTDSSGNSNDFAVTNLVATDQVGDGPKAADAVVGSTSAGGNFCTLNPGVKPFGTITWTEGNLKAAASAVFQGTAGTILAGPSGKWYWEHYIHTVGNTFTGVVLPSDTSWFRGAAEGPQQAGSSITYNNNGYTYIDGSQSGSIWGATYTTGDIIGIAVDMDTSNGQVTFYKNGTSQGTLSFTGNNMAGATNVVPGTVLNGATATFNFGQDSSFAGEETAQGNSDSNGIGDFYYAPPTDYLAICSANLSAPSIKLPAEHFNTVLYTGTGGAQSITGVGFQPDLVWVKSRSNDYQPGWVDAVRGVENYISSSETDAEATTSGAVDAFDSDGFSFGGSGTVWNGTGATFASWNWKANGSGSANTDGSLDSTVSANPTAGFSIVSYTGNSASAQTIGHGLSVAPELIVVKNRTDVVFWPAGTVYGGGWTKYLNWDSVEPQQDNTYFNDTAPTASVFSVDTNNAVNGNTNQIIAYCFHSVEGYQKIGLYEGNSNIDGPFIYTGFRPAFIILKYIDGSDWWFMFDDKRPGYNMTNLSVTVNDAVEENDASTGQQDIDILSNGFKITDAGGGNNSSGTYLYIAIAKSPFKYSNAR